MAPRSAWKWTGVFGSPAATRLSARKRFHGPCVSRASLPTDFPSLQWARISSTICSCSSSGMPSASTGAWRRALSCARPISWTSWSIISTSPSHSARRAPPSLAAATAEIFQRCSRFNSSTALVALASTLSSAAVDASSRGAVQSSWRWLRFPLENRSYSCTACSNSSGVSSVLASGRSWRSSLSSSTLRASVLAYSSLISAFESGKATPASTGAGSQPWTSASAATLRAASEGESFVFRKITSRHSSARASNISWRCLRSWSRSSLRSMASCSASASSFFGFPVVSRSMMVETAPSSWLRLSMSLSSTLTLKGRSFSTT